MFDIWDRQKAVLPTQLDDFDPSNVFLYKKKKKNDAKIDKNLCYRSDFKPIFLKVQKVLKRPKKYIKTNVGETLVGYEVSGSNTEYFAINSRGGRGYVMAEDVEVISETNPIISDRLKGQVSNLGQQGTKRVASLEFSVTDASSVSGSLATKPAPPSWNPPGFSQPKHNDTSQIENSLGTGVMEDTVIDSIDHDVTPSLLHSVADRSELPNLSKMDSSTNESVKPQPPLGPRPVLKEDPSHTGNVQEKSVGNDS